MGLYIYINESDRNRFKTVKDKYLNEEFKEALKHDNSLLISSYDVFTKRFWKPDLVETRYQIYHDVEPNKPAYQAYQQGSASGKKEVIIAYLHGIINGSIAKDR